MALIEEQLAKGSSAAAFAADVDGADATVRTTLVVGQYWTNTAKTAAAIRSAAARANGWGDAKVVLYCQITNWYLNCAYPANPYCSRADLASKPFDEIKDTFEAELEETLEDVPEGWRVFRHRLLHARAQRPDCGDERSRPRRARAPPRGQRGPRPPHRLPRAHDDATELGARRPRRLLHSDSGAAHHRQFGGRQPRDDGGGGLRTRPSTRRGAASSIRWARPAATAAATRGRTRRGPANSRRGSAQTSGRASFRPARRSKRRACAPPGAARRRRTCAPKRGASAVCARTTAARRRRRRRRSRSRRRPRARSFSEPSVAVGPDAARARRRPTMAEAARARGAAPRRPAGASAQASSSRRSRCARCAPR